MDQDIVFEALSALVGVNIRSGSTGSTAPKLQSGYHVLSVQGLLSAVSLGTGFTQDVGYDHTGAGSSSTSRNDIFVMKEDFFDPEFDRDFTNPPDATEREEYTRGSEKYSRPYGWKRYGLKVLNKYADGNIWLGSSGPRDRTQSVEGEWPVSYHGTSLDGATGIATDTYQPGPGQAYGRGVYSTPNIQVADNYAKTFDFNNKRYKVCLQNRINPNPNFREKTVIKDYWLVPIPKGKLEEKKFIMSAIRPYGLLLKEIQ